jgi:uncharacterized protein (TIGR03435 family)
MIPSGLLPIANHLWQSTLFAGIAGLLTLLLRDNRAGTRYCLWIAASAKFLVPFSLLVLAGSQFQRHTFVEPAPSRVPIIVEQVNEPFVAEVSPGPTPSSQPSQSSIWLVPILVAVWATGCGALVFSWSLRWQRMQVVVRAASPLALKIGVPVLSSASVIEPGVFGVFRPVLLLPDGIASHLAPAELQAILAHELCHVRRRDNLATAMHMVVEAMFWFHPVVWWVGARLLEERERSCDEEVVRMGSAPEAYAEGILKICGLYLQSPLKCVAGVTGANLKGRIEAIMSKRAASKLNFAKKAGLALTGILAVSIPVIIGVTNARALRAQGQPAPRFEVASIKACSPGGRGAFPGITAPTPGRITVNCVSVMTLIRWSYILHANGRTMNLAPEKIVPMEKSPAWIDTDLYTIDAKAESKSGPAPGQAMMLGPMMQALLEDRFKLKIHRENRQVPIYALTAGKDGLKLPAAPKGGCALQDLDQPPAPPAPGKAPLLICGMPLIMNNGFDMRGATMAQLSTVLSGWVDRKVIDKTGITGMFDIRLDWSGGELPSGPTPPPPPPQPGVPPPPGPDPAEVTAGVKTALQKLGLKLEPSQGPAEILVVVHVERPTEN